MLPTTSERSRCVARSSLPTSVHHDLPAALRTCAHRKHSLARPHTTATTEKTAVLFLCEACSGDSTYWARSLSSASASSTPS